jgi:Bacterial Ig domain
MTSLFLASGGVVNPPADLPPAVTITSPAAGATLSGSVTITASASDTGGVVSVAYRVDNGSAVVMSQTGGSSQNGVWSATLDTRQIADGAHTITVVATDTASQQSSPSVGVSIRNSTTQKTHVERIDVALVVKSSRAQAKCTPQIKDAFGVSVSGAVVAGRWSGAATDTFSITTDSLGNATDYSNAATLVSGMTFTCIIDSVSKSGWTYDASANKQSSASVRAP